MAELRANRLAICCGVLEYWQLKYSLVNIILISINLGAMYAFANTGDWT